VFVWLLKRLAEQHSIWSRFDVKGGTRPGRHEQRPLETRDLSKDFAGFRAVKKVNLEVREGSIHALIGPNGAGKTTVFNLLTKFLAPSAGRILYRGRDITNLKPAEIARMGIVRSFQISAVFPHMSLLENLRVAMQRPTRPGAAGRGRPRRPGARARRLSLLRAQARARDRDHLVAGARADAARRAHGRNGP
jgi:ABC-type branched-subunit amino acid transport system ATPase component